jgi:PAS domain S-box-containing protein
MKNDGGEEKSRRRMRELARAMVRSKRPDLGELADLSPHDLKVLLHEFGVYQVELETQNEELRETREQLRDARDRYQALYDFAPVGYLTLDAGGFIRESNLAAARLFGRSRAELTGRQLQTLLDSAGSGRLAELLEERIAGVQEARVGERGRHLRLDLAPGQEEDDGGFWVTAIDVTETRQAEKERNRGERRFHTLAETSPLGIFEADHAGRFSYVNRQWEKITGLSAERSLHFGWTAAIHPEDRPRVAGEWSGRIGEGPWSQEFRLNRGDGTEAWARMLSTPSGMMGQRPTGYVGTLEDITALRHAERGMLRAKKEAEEANRAKSEFLANMSHEIRTPLTVTIGALDLLLDFVSDDRQRQLVEMAASSSESLLRLLNDILDFSKIEAGKMDLHLESCSLKDCLEKVLTLFELEARKKGLRLSVDLRPGLPEIIVSDQERLQQVLRNLVSNAVKFTEQGEITMGAEPAEGAVRFFVRDTGIGIPPEKIEQLFRTFSQLDPSRTRKYGGSGLGLAICKALVALMGGKIGVENFPGEGCLFHFTLPLREAPATSEGATAEETTGVMALLHARILLVDDDDMVRSMVEAILSRWQCEVVTAATGAEAVRTWETEDFDLILMDIQMPKMDGLEATRRIREMESQSNTHIPIIALTAHVRSEDQRECLDAGMDAWVTKPIDTRLLYQTIKRRITDGKPTHDR